MYRTKEKIEEKVEGIKTWDEIVYKKMKIFLELNKLNNEFIQKKSFYKY